MRPPVDVSRSWCRDSTTLLLGAVDRSSDAELDAPSALPGWSRRHLLAHVGFNAEALRRLAAWARTGVPCAMYASPEQRVTEIEQGAGWPAARLREFVATSARALEADLDGLGPEQWEAQVVTAQGRTVPAAEIPWLRTREVAVHLVDLEVGCDFADLPDDLCAALVSDVAALRSTRGTGPPLRLRSDGGSTWAVEGSGQPVTVRAPVSAVAQWLTGRGAGDLTDVDGHPVPEIGPWI